MALRSVLALPVAGAPAVGVRFTSLSTSVWATTGRPRAVKVRVKNSDGEKEVEKKQYSSEEDFNLTRAISMLADEAAAFVTTEMVDPSWDEVLRAEEQQARGEALVKFFSCSSLSKQLAVLSSIAREGAGESVNLCGWFLQLIQHTDSRMRLCWGASAFVDLQSFPDELLREFKWYATRLSDDQQKAVLAMLVPNLPDKIADLETIVALALPLWVIIISTPEDKKEALHDMAVKKEERLEKTLRSLICAIEQERAAGEENEQ